MEHTVVLIPGDGIGPEVAQAAVLVVEASGAQVNWLPRQAGLAAIEAGESQVLPEATLEAIRTHQVALKGPCTTPVGEGFTSVNVALRKHLGLFGAVRPVRTMPGVTTRYSDAQVDLVIVRENTEGLYAGIENQISEGVVTSLKVVTESASRRIARFAFEYAHSRQRRKVTVLHKANIMKMGDGLFLQCAREEAKAWEGKVEFESRIIDAGCMQLVQSPQAFDVLLCENLYGDVMSDLCAGFVGGLGVTPGANFGDEGRAVFEAVHGSAPDIAGQDRANPLALIMSAVMLLRHLAETTQDVTCTTCADRIRDAYNACLLAGETTADLGGSLGTMAFADAICKRLS
ncbi:MAG: isocitrate/isopropylmalate dehydrogenase family protein [Phycisphaerales bacterium]|nr:isocitrate/isopropylmalate dehydrogenase family protein [Phycisphaerales bacterium]